MKNKANRIYGIILLVFCVAAITIALIKVGITPIFTDPTKARMLLLYGLASLGIGTSIRIIMID